MRNIEFDNIVNEKLQQIIAIEESTRVIVENERLRLLSLLKGKHIVVQGQKGWNKGVVKDVRTSLSFNFHKVGNSAMGASFNHEYPLPIFRLEIRQTNNSTSKYVSLEDARIMTSEEIAAFEKLLAIDVRINNRSNSPQA